MCVLHHLWSYVGENPGMFVSCIFFILQLVVLSLLQKHPHIVELYGACVSDHPFIVLEFAPLSLEKGKYIYECLWYNTTCT